MVQLRRLTVRRHRAGVADTIFVGVWSDPRCGPCAWIERRIERPLGECDVGGGRYELGKSRVGDGVPIDQEGIDGDVVSWSFFRVVRVDPIRNAPPVIIATALCAIELR